MKRYRLVEVGCNHDVYAIAEDDGDDGNELNRHVVAKWTFSDGEDPAWMRRPLAAFAHDLVAGFKARKATKAQPDTDR